MAPPRILAVVALLAALVVPGTASAARTKAPSQLTAAMTVAERYWGATPCGGRVRLLTQQPVAPGSAPATDAWATFATPLGVNDLAAPPSSFTDCTVAFAAWRWPTAASMQEDAELVCATMVHEIGHLLGHEHDTTPGSVMTAVFADRSAFPAACRATRPGRAARLRAPRR